MKTKTSLLYGVMLIISSLLTNTLFAQFATTSLNNLTGTQINKSLLPKKNNTIDLGSSTKSWANLNLSGKVMNGTTAIIAIYDAGNTLIGKNAGSNVGNTGSNNTMVGAGSGNTNTTGGSNSFFGTGAGAANTTAGGNCFFGFNSGANNTTSEGNSFFGFNSGITNTDGTANSFFGNTAGANNSTGGSNSFYGFNTGANTTTGDNNSFLGREAGFFNTSGANNTYIGYQANGDVAGDLNNTTAIGNGALATASDQVRVGDASVGSIGGYQDWTNISDGRFKKNILENVKGLEFINKLRPITYTLDVEGLNKFLGVKSSSSQNASDAAIQQKEKMVNSGFIAQEVEKAAGEAGYDFSGVDAPKNDHDVYGLRYAEFVVPLVKSVQELSAENDQLKSMIADLQSQINELKNGNNSTKQINAIELSGARLEQNAPNPFNQSTTINYYLPEKCNSAIVQIISSSGEVIKSVSLSQNGNGQLILKAGELSAGSYSYQLVIDGKIIDSKQMILTK